MSESLQSIDKKCVFRETFENEQSVRRNGGIPTNVVFNNEVGTFNGVSSNVIINRPLYGTYSIVIKFKHTVAVAGYFMELRNILGSGVGYIVMDAANAVVSNSGTIYIDGVASTVVSLNTWHTIVASGVILNASSFIIGNRYTSEQFLDGDIALYEIYSGVLTSDEIKNLYENKRYKILNPNRLEQLGVEFVDQQHWADIGLGWWSFNLGCWTGDGTKIICNGGIGDLYKQNQLTAGKMYKWVISITVVSGSVNFYAGTWPMFVTIYSSVSNAVYYPVANSHYIYLYSQNFVGSIDLLEVKEVTAYSNTREILNVSAINGTIRNKYSGELYTNLIPDASSTFQTDGTAYWYLGDSPALTKTWNSGGWMTIASPSLTYWYIAVIDLCTAGKTYNISFKFRGLGAYTMYAYIGTNYQADQMICSSEWQTYNRTTVADNTTLFIQTTYPIGSIDITDISVKEVIPTVTPTDVNVIKENDVYVMRFNGTSSQINCGSYDTLIGDKTFSFWTVINSKSDISSHYFINNSKFIIAYHGGNYISVYSNANNSANSSSSVIKLNVPFHIGVTRDSIGITNIYINGVLCGTANQSSDTPVAGTVIYLGYWNGYYLKGWMNNLRIIDGILTSQEISQLYSSEKHLYGF